MLEYYREIQEFVGNSFVPDSRIFPVGVYCYVIEHCSPIKQV